MYHLNVTDLTGRVVMNGNYQFNEGKNYKDIDLTRLHKGMYLMHITQENGTHAIQQITLE